MDSIDLELLPKPLTLLLNQLAEFVDKGMKYNKHKVLETLTV